MTTSPTHLKNGRLELAAAACALLQRVLVPLDGSALAERALPYARYLGRLCRSDLILTRVVAAHGHHDDPYESPLEAVMAAETYLERLADSYQAEYAVEYSVPCGDPASEIARVAEKRDARLIVMATGGWGGRRRLTGSVAHALLRCTPLPLLLIPATLERAGWEHGPRHILVALDGSPLAEHALPYAAALAAASHGRLTLERVVEPWPAAPEPARIDQARDYLARQAAPLRWRGLEVAIEVAVGPPAAELVAAAAQSDVVVLTLPSGEELDELLPGSVAESVIQAAVAPVLLVRPQP